jgi:hypothetical protein
MPHECINDRIPQLARWLADAAPGVGLVRKLPQRLGQSRRIGGVPADHLIRLHMKPEVIRRALSPPIHGRSAGNGVEGCVYLNHRKL